jgi:hypothetical protein
MKSANKFTQAVTFLASSATGINGVMHDEIEIEGWL